MAVSMTQQELFEESGLTVEKQLDRVTVQIRQLTSRRMVMTLVQLLLLLELIAVAALLTKDGKPVGQTQQVELAGLWLVGMLSNLFWWREVVQRRKLLSWWYAQIRRIERQLPKSQRVFTMEYLRHYHARGKLSVSWFEAALALLAALVCTVIFGLTVYALVSSPVGLRLR